MQKLKTWQSLFCSNTTSIDHVEYFQNVGITVKRDDQNHPIIQGNKLRKLKYNFKYAIENNKTILVTFGGAWSNHIIATATAASICGLESIGFIRGEELKNCPHLWSKTLIRAKEAGMKLYFLSREDYRLKQCSNEVVQLLRQIEKQVFLIPEGGSNKYAIQGVAEIASELKEQRHEPTHIVTACGTGGTMAGLIKGVSQFNWNTKIIGIPVLKNGMVLKNEIKLMVGDKFKNWQLFDSYHFGGYGKINSDLIQFGQEFVKRTGIDLDKVYTSKAFYASYDLIKSGDIPPKSKLLILHTGGLQGGSVTNVI